MSVTLAASQIRVFDGTKIKTSALQEPRQYIGVKPSLSADPVTARQFNLDPTTGIGT
jgi:hypothetical protein